MKAKFPWFDSAFLKRFVVWLVVFFLIGYVQFKRNRLEWIDLKIGSPELSFYLMPSNVGVEYLPEVYAAKWVELHGIDYNGLPFNGPFQSTLYASRSESARPFGDWIAYSLNNGGVHWTKSYAIPLWPIYLVFAFLLARYVRFRRSPQDNS